MVEGRGALSSKQQPAAHLRNTAPGWDSQRHILVLRPQAWNLRGVAGKAMGEKVKRARVG
jgi:hypothetical protein